MKVRHCFFVLLFMARAGAADGVEFSAAYTADVLSVVSGGLSSGTEYLDKLDLELQLDLAEAWQPGNGKILIHGLYNNDTSFSDARVGDLQVVSNIDAAGGWRLFQLWYEFGDADWSIRSGLYDLNTEFDVNETGGLFLNSSHGVGAELGLSGRNGPGIFPLSALAVRAAISLDALSARVVVMDGAPEDLTESPTNWFDLNGEDGVLTVVEVETPHQRSMRFWAGYWRYSAEFEHLAAERLESGNDGWYVGGETRLRIGSRDTSWFIRYGEADERFNPFRRYVGLGAVLAGPLKNRPADELGFAVASGRGGGAYRDATTVPGERASRHETSWELTYRISVNDRLVVQPDIQYVQNPGLSTQADNAWIVGCRILLVY